MGQPACFTSQKKDSAKAIRITAISLPAYDAWLDKRSARIKNWIEANGFRAKKESFLVLPGGNGSVQSVLAIYDPEKPHRCFSNLAEKLPSKHIYTLGENVSASLAYEAALGWGLGGYRFDRYKEKQTQPPVLCFPRKADKKTVLRYLEGARISRDLINIPAIDLGTEELADEAKKIAQSAGAQVTEIVGKELLKKNYPAIYTVGMASPRLPRLVDITWGNPKHPKITLIGKGVIYDTGGLSIKPNNNMLLMKKDMGGAAHALSVLSMVADAKLPVRLRVLLPIVENAVAGNAYRPGDIISTRSGKSVEITNTDAEGRLIMADCLTEAVSEKPEFVIDFATLTGASRVAVGHEMASLMCNDKSMQAKIMQANDKEGDRLWPLPLNDDYRSQLSSKVADINHCPLHGFAGAILAGLFLESFLGDNPPRWAHMDSPGWNKFSVPGYPVGGDAFGVWALYRFIKDQV